MQISLQNALFVDTAQTPYSTGARARSNEELGISVPGPKPVTDLRSAIEEAIREVFSTPTPAVVPKTAVEAEIRRTENQGAVDEPNANQRRLDEGKNQEKPIGTPAGLGSNQTHPHITRLPDVVAFVIQDTQDTYVPVIAQNNRPTTPNQYEENRSDKPELRHTVSTPYFGPNTPNEFRGMERENVILPFIPGIEEDNPSNPVVGSNRNQTFPTTPDMNSSRKSESNSNDNYLSTPLKPATAINDRLSEVRNYFDTPNTPQDARVTSAMSMTIANPDGETRPENPVSTPNETAFRPPAFDLRSYIGNMSERAQRIRESIQTPERSPKNPNVGTIRDFANQLVKLGVPKDEVASVIRNGIRVTGFTSRPQIVMDSLRELAERHGIDPKSIAEAPKPSIAPQNARVAFHANEMLNAVTSSGRRHLSIATESVSPAIKVDESPVTIVSPVGTPSMQSSGITHAAETQRPTIPAQPILERVINRIQDMLENNRREEMTLRLDPPELGSLKVTVRSIGQRVETHIVASNPEVRALLEANREQLIQSLSERGLELGAMHVGAQANTKREPTTANEAIQRNPNMRVNDSPSVAQGRRADRAWLSTSLFDINV
jgi:hypothetical protein